MTSCQIVYSFSGTLVGYLHVFGLVFAWFFLSCNQHLFVSVLVPTRYYFDHPTEACVVVPVGKLLVAGVICLAEFIPFLEVGPPEIFPGSVVVSVLMQPIGADITLGLPPTSYIALFEEQVDVVKIASTHEMKNHKHT